jgi:hypothetical protein
MRLAVLRRPAGLPALLVLTLALGGGVAGCSDSDDHAVPPASSSETGGAPSQAATTVVVPAGDATVPTSEEVTATWKARPDYVRALPGKWQEAYAFALARPDVLQWIPCYCGCDGLGHRSNLDCFFKQAGVFEEHGSYCDICVETANLASQMIREGSSMAEIRAAVDATFGNDHGTDTPLPPA